MIDLFSVTRPAGDLLSRVVRLTFAGTEYELPVLPIAGNKRWKAQLDGAFAGLLDGLTSAGDDLPAILTALSSQTDALLDLLYAYDTSSKLPPREVLEETIYEDELIVAIQGVWLAANPSVVTTVTALQTQTEPSSPPTSSPPRRTAGSRKKSSAN